MLGFFVQKIDREMLSPVSPTLQWFTVILCLKKLSKATFEAPWCILLLGKGVQSMAYGNREKPQRDGGLGEGTCSAVT